jgi:ribonuclease HI
MTFTIARGTVSTDGSALRNPNGPMGWGWVDHDTGEKDSGGAVNGTNQIGELSAVLEALRHHRDVQNLTIETDSRYAIGCSRDWVDGWKRHGWKNSQKKPVSNLALVKAINEEIESKKSEGGSVDFVWVKGHAGNKYNEIVDHLAHGYSSAVQAGHEQGRMPIEGWAVLLADRYVTKESLPDVVVRELTRLDFA